MDIIEILSRTVYEVRDRQYRYVPYFPIPKAQWDAIVKLLNTAKERK